MEKFESLDVRVFDNGTVKYNQICFAFFWLQLNQSQHRIVMFCAFLDIFSVGLLFETVSYSVQRICSSYERYEMK